MFQQFRLQLARFMEGRHGMDALSKTLLILSLVVMFVFRLIPKLQGVALFGLALFIYSIWRCLSRNQEKRYLENIRFTNIKEALRSERSVAKMRLSDRNTHRYFRCPICGTWLRVPKGKGTIKISCPHCGGSIIKKT